MTFSDCSTEKLPHLEVNMNVISKDIHAKELSGTDLAGVLLIAVCQQMFVHVTPAGEHLCTQTLSVEKYSTQIS